ncbi:MAG: hypothetical protein R2714_16490 [Microthrixaceae bacterium]
MNDLGADATSQETADAFRSKIDQPLSFDGHPYTCDGKQIPALDVRPSRSSWNWSDPASSSRSPRGWVDVPTIIADTVG